MQHRCSTTRSGSYQRLLDLDPGGLSEPPDPRREDRQAEPRRVRPRLPSACPSPTALTIPVLFDPATGGVINSSGSPNDLHSVTIWDDLDATGVGSHVSQSRRLLAEQRRPRAAHILQCGWPAHLRQSLPIIPGWRADRHRDHGRTRRHAGQRAGDAVRQHRQVGFRDDSSTACSTSPCRASGGLAQPLTIAAPYLVVTKTGPATLGLTMNLGQWGEFGRRRPEHSGSATPGRSRSSTGSPMAPAGGMCNTTPEILSAQVFAADGTLPRSPGKGPLIPKAPTSHSATTARPAASSRSP